MSEGLILILFLIAFIAISIARFHAGVLFTVVVLPLYVVRFSIGPLPSTLLEVMILSLAAIWIFKKTKRNEWNDFFREWMAHKSSRVLLVSIALVLVFATIGVAVSPEKRAALGVWRAYFIEPALFFFILSDILRSRQMLRRVFFASVLSAFSIACIAVYQRLTGWGIPQDFISEARVTSIFPYPNAVGLYVAPITAFVFGLTAFFLTKKKSKFIKTSIALLGFFVGASLILAIIFSQTEAALAALGVGGVLFLLVWSNATRKAAASLLVLFFLTLVVSQPLASFFSQKIFLKDWSGKVRKGVWKETTAMLKDHWIAGAGISGYKTVFKPYHTRTHIEIFQYPHSFILNFWSEIGLFGLMSVLFLVGMFFFFALSALKRMRRLPRSDDTHFFRASAVALLSTMTIILVHGLVDVPYFKNDLSVFFWLLMALVVSVERQVKAL